MTTCPGAAERHAVDESDELWPRGGFFLVTAPATAITKHMLGAPELAAMKSDAWVANVTRVPRIDMDALVEALAAGGIGGAGLDVTDPEPLPEDTPYGPNSAP